MRQVPQEAIDLITSLEKLVLRVYDDKRPDYILKPGDVVEGTLTAGYGHTGSDLAIGLEVTDAVAVAWLTSDLSVSAREIERKIGAVVDELTVHQYAALLSFVFNLGTGNPEKPEWTIWKRLRSREFDQVPLEMAKFVNWNGKKSNGLVNRRNAEIAEWATQEPGSEPTNPPSSVTRATPTPPTPAEPKSPAKSGAIVTGVAGAVAAAPPMINQATQTIQPFALHSEYVRHALGILAAIGAVLAVAGLVLAWLDRRKARN